MLAVWEQDPLRQPLLELRHPTQLNTCHCDTLSSHTTKALIGAAEEFSQLAGQS
jgi:hypothetical protein